MTKPETRLTVKAYQSSPTAVRIDVRRRHADGGQVLIWAYVPSSMQDLAHPVRREDAIGYLAMKAAVQYLQRTHGLPRQGTVAYLTERLRRTRAEVRVQKILTPLVREALNEL